MVLAPKIWRPQDFHSVSGSRKGGFVNTVMGT